MKKKIFGWIAAILGIVNLILTIAFEIYVWDMNKLDIFKKEFKMWVGLVFLWVTFGYFFLRWSCEEYLDYKYKKKGK